MKGLKTFYIRIAVRFLMTAIITQFNDHCSAQCDGVQLGPCQPLLPLEHVQDHPDGWVHVQADLAD